MHENETYEERPYFSGPLGVFRIIAMTIGGLIAAVCLAFLFGWLVMWLWNTLMPPLFGFKIITYWQAFGLIILAKLFFGGHGWHSGWRHRNYEDKMKYKMWKRHWRKHRRDWDDWAPSGDYGNWKYYDDYWHSEGKSAFESYIARIKNERSKEE